MWLDETQGTENVFDIGSDFDMVFGMQLHTSVEME
jgi:hypothetical protein